MTKPTIYVETETLTDGSEVFNVRLGGEVFHAIDVNAAVMLAEARARRVTTCDPKDGLREKP
jgi:hypothetical protein